MKDFQQRVVSEKEELDHKIEKLTAFIRSEKMKSLPVAEQIRLDNQLHHMNQYSLILGNRINKFS